MIRKKAIILFILFWGYLFFFWFSLPCYSETNSNNLQSIVTIDFRSSSKVSSDKVTVGDLANIFCQDKQVLQEIKGIDVCLSPKAGESKIISADTITASLRNSLPSLGVPLNKVNGQLPVKIVVQRVEDKKAQKIFSKIYRDYVYKHMLWKRENVVISNIDVGETSHVPGKRDVSYKVRANPGLAYIGNTPITIVFYRNQHRVGSVNITGKIQVFKPVARVTHYIKSHHIISSDDIQFVSMDISDLAPDVILSSSSVLGKEAVRSLNAGKLLRKRDVEEPVVIQRGDMITLVIETPALRITSKGIAMENGRIGQEMRIKNIATKRIVLGQVKDSNTVQVTF